MVPTGSDLCAAAASLIRVKRARAKRRRSRGGLTFILSDGTGRPRGECVPEGRACAHKYKASTHLCLVFFLRTKHLGLERTAAPCARPAAPCTNTNMEPALRFAKFAFSKNPPGCWSYALVCFSGPPRGPNFNEGLTWGFEGT